MNHHSSDDDEEGPPLPAAAAAAASSNRRGGWQGEALEMEHQRLHDNNSSKGSNSFTAVNLDQFRNTIVGEGYQAKHVVRQRTVVERTTDKSTTTAKKLSSSSERRQDETTNSASASVPATSSTQMDLQTLLQNDGLRTFCKEIDSILSSPS